jgi:predicted RNA binding protein YcfA (HicA-like mRNA interferase family)
VNRRLLHNREVRALVELAEQRGWIATPTRSGHIRLTHPNGGIVHIASTPSSRATRRCVVGELRRAERRWSSS